MNWIPHTKRGQVAFISDRKNKPAKNRGMEKPAELLQNVTAANVKN